MDAQSTLETWVVIKIQLPRRVAVVMGLKFSLCEEKDLCACGHVVVGEMEG